MLGMDGLIACVKKKKGAGAISAFGVARRTAELTKEGCLLIACYTQDGQAIRQKGQSSSLAIMKSTGMNRWQNRAWDPEITAQFVIPVGCLQVQQKCAGRVRNIGCMNLAARQSCDQKAVNSAAGYCPSLGAGS